MYLEPIKKSVWVTKGFITGKGRNNLWKERLGPENEQKI